MTDVNEDEWPFTPIDYDNVTPGEALGQIRMRRQQSQVTVDERLIFNQETAEALRIAGVWDDRYMRYV